MCVKINWSFKTPWHRPSMGVARSGLWAPVSAFSIFAVSHFVMEAVRQTKKLLINLDKSIVDEGFMDLAPVVQKMDSTIHR